jgi:hypothetical protein
MTLSAPEATPTPPKKIYQAVPKIMAEVEPIAKTRLNKDGGGYMFRGIDDIYAALQLVLAKHGVFTVPTIIGRERRDVTSQAGKKGQQLINHFRFRFYADDGSFIEADADGEGIDYGDKASNKCASIAHKYALLQVFCIPTAEPKDPDEESPTQGAWEKEAREMPPLASGHRSSPGSTPASAATAKSAQSAPVQQELPTGKPADTPAPAGSGGLIGPNERKHLETLRKQAGWTIADMQGHIKFNYEVNTSSEMTMPQYQDLSTWLARKAKPVVSL